MVTRRTEDTERMAISELRRYKLRMQILLFLYKKHPQTASSLSKKTHVSLPTIRAVLDDLIHERVVCIPGVGASKGGRRPALYSHAPDAFHILSIELGHHNAKATIFNSLNETISSICEFDTTINDPDFPLQVEIALKTLLHESQLNRNQIIAIGVSMPGLIDTDSGINRTIKNSALQNVKHRLTLQFDLPIYIENDARMQALGEFVFGKAQKTQNTLVLNWHWGLGLGVILNGQIFQGSSGNAGEFSHIRILPEGQLCECGKQGCLQTIASAQTLLDMARKKIKEGAVSQLTKRFKKEPTKLTIQDIIQCAKNGDELSISLLNDLSKKLAWGLSILIQLYNPELIVLNGPLAKAQQYVLVPIQQTLNQYCLESILNNVKIEISEMGEHSGLKGVAVMVFQKIFSDKSVGPYYLS